MNNKVKDRERLQEGILQIKQEMGNRLFIPAHHYQRPEIVELADIVGDSYKLSVDVSKTDADYIVFCGVRFMAEGAAILGKPHQTILIPEPSAVCPMAEMITAEQAEDALAKLQSVSSHTVIPIVYMNAHADMKAFCGRHGGAVCTSSNAEKILNYYFKQDAAVFFFPDQHLGINTARTMGLLPKEIMKLLSDYTLVPAVEDINTSSSTGIREEATGRPEDDKYTKIYVWDGFCPVHQRFSKKHITNLRSRYPGITIIVHPEVDKSVAIASDITGSTQQIYQIVKDAKPNTSWGIGTEYNFVKRIANEFKYQNKTIVPLEKNICENMDKTTLSSLFDTLKEVQKIERERTQQADTSCKDTGAERQREVVIPKGIRADAKIALSKMITIVEGV